MSKTVHELNLHESILVNEIREHDFTSTTTAIRVPGGWIYSKSVRIGNQENDAISVSTVFIPHNEEFNNQKK